jgi:hypothetical protein
MMVFSAVWLVLLGNCPNIGQCEIDTVLPLHAIFEKTLMGRAFSACAEIPSPLGIRLAMDIGMDNNMNKASVSLLAMATLVIAAIFAKIRATAAAQAPEGYEDATGFHFGHPSFEE